MFFRVLQFSWFVVCLLKHKGELKQQCLSAKEQPICTAHSSGWGGVLVWTGWQCCVEGQRTRLFCGIIQLAESGHTIQVHVPETGWKSLRWDLFWELMHETVWKDRYQFSKSKQLFLYIRLSKNSRIFYFINNCPIKIFHVLGPWWTFITWSLMAWKWNVSVLSHHWRAKTCWVQVTVQIGLKKGKLLALS